MSERIVFCWSGGKDSALALHRMLHDDRYTIISLLTTVNQRFARASMHGVRLELAQAQAHDLGFRSIVCCVSDAYLDETALGRIVDWDFINMLPSDVRIDVTVGEKVYRRVEQTTPDGAKGFRFCDLLPAKGQDDDGGVPKVEWQ